MQELGAEVIKVEMPLRGDDARYFGPFKNGKSAYFMSVNRGKKSISLNLKSPKGKAILLKLAEKADVITENFRPGTMEKLGLSYDEIKKVNPQIIYASTSGFGQTGPDSKKPAYDMLVQAMSGMMSITGWQDKPPTRVGVSIGDLGAGLYTIIGIISALYSRAITGKGQRVDVAMLDCQLSLLENAIVRHDVNGESPKPGGNQHPTITPFQVFRTKDSYMAISVGNNAMWQNFCKLLKREDLLENPDFADNMKRTENRDKLLPQFEEILEKQNLAYWEKLFDQAKLPYSPVNSIGEAMQHPQVAARNMIVETTDSITGKMKMAGNPIKMTNIPEEKTRVAPPEIGQHNKEIYGTVLGFSESEIKALEAEGVI